jgi:hypothetical protein
VILALAVFVTLLPELPKSGENNLYTLQAEAFLQGRLALARPHHDVAIYNGRYYVPFPPFPALVLLPFVAVFGVAHTYPVPIALVLAIVSVFVFVRLLRRLQLKSDATFWLTLAFFFGTGYWYVTANTAGVWFFAHVVAILCILLALWTAFASGGPWLVGILIGLAFLSRQLNLFAAIFVWALLWAQQEQHGERRGALAMTLQFGLGLAVPVAVYLAFNWLRFGHPLETGYGYLPQVFFLKERIARYGLFSLTYVPFNFINMFVEGPYVKFAGPTLTHRPEMELLGTSLTFASPFLFLAFAARWQRLLLATAWLSVGLTVAVLLLYFVNGWTQVNTQRYTLDFTPVLMLLVARGVQRIEGTWWQWLVVYAVVLNIATLIGIPLLAGLMPG